MLFIIKADHSTITIQNKIIIGFLICNRATTHARCCRRRRTTRTMDYMHYIAFSCTFKQKIMQSAQRFCVCVSCIFMDKVPQRKKRNIKIYCLVDCLDTPIRPFIMYSF